MKSSGVRVKKKRKSVKEIREDESVVREAIDNRLNNPSNRSNQASKYDSELRKQEVKRDYFEQDFVHKLEKGKIDKKELQLEYEAMSSYPKRFKLKESKLPICAIFNKGFDDSRRHQGNKERDSLCPVSINMN